MLSIEHSTFVEYICVIWMHLCNACRQFEAVWMDTLLLLLLLMMMMMMN